MLDQILNHLPYRPYCTDDLACGLKIRSAETAKTQKYLQINPPTQQYYLIFDVDYEQACFSWEKAGLAPPNYVAVNPENGHAHIVYKLAEPVCTSWENGRLAPLRYLSAIEQAYRIELKADVGFSGLITRNPYKSHTMCLHTHEYDLFELSDWLKHDLSYYAEKEQKQGIVAGIGRNVELFDSVRKWAYRHIRSYRVENRSRLFNAWHKEVLEKALSINSEFPTPLQFSEVKATAKSIAKYCWKTDAIAEQQFSQKQSEKGKLGGVASGVSRTNKNEEKRKEARILSAKGNSLRKIAEILDVSKSAVGLWLQQFKVSNEAKSDDSAVGRVFRFAGSPDRSKSSISIDLQLIVSHISDWLKGYLLKSEFFIDEIRIDDST